MSKEEVKIAIAEMLEHSSEKVLKTVYSYLKNNELLAHEQTSLAEHTQIILKEDKEVLHRLSK